MITKKQLIEALATFDEDAPVFVAAFVSAHLLLGPRTEFVEVESVCKNGPAIQLNISTGYDSNKTQLRESQEQCKKLQELLEGLGMDDWHREILED